MRRSTTDGTYRLRWLLGDDFCENRNFSAHYCDLMDANRLLQILDEVKPDEVYNLAAQSHVGASFQQPVYTADVDALGPLRILDGIKMLGLSTKTRFYQASTSELFGKVLETPQRETTPFYPRSPYAVGKLFAFWMTVNYREAYDLYACNGILFNHESPIRGEDFVTRKITLGLARIKAGKQERLLLGNLNSMRDWGHARDYVDMQWLMLQQDNPEDFVIATGEQRSVRDFVDIAASFMELNISWEGEGLDEKGIDQDGRVLVAVSPKFYRPTEVDSLLGDPTKARDRLGWVPQTPFSSLVEEMAREDLMRVRNESS